MLQLKIPPPAYLLIFATLMYLLAKYLPIMSLFSEPITKISYVFIIMGIVLDLFAVSQFLRSKTTVNPIKPKNTNNIVSTGIYRISRNPMYLGMLFLLTGWAIHLAALTPFLLLPVFIVVLTLQQIIPEEKILAQKFGDTYLHYKQQVRRWI